MTDAQKQARLIVRLSEENRLLRQKGKRLKKALSEAMDMNTELSPANLTRWRKALES